jgi:hypothetical protein
MTSKILLGHRVKSKKPLYVTRSLFGHAHVRGMTGSGKTSLALIPLAKEFLAPYEASGVAQRDPLFVFDLGGDQNLFAHVRAEANRQGRTFRYLTLDPDLDTYYFPPFQAVPTGERNIIRICQMLVQAFHMDHGLVYGGHYYTQQNMGALLRVARKLTQQNTNPTLYDAARYLDDPRHRRQFKDADQVRMTFDFLLEYPQLDRTKSPKREIDMGRALSHSEVIYFFTPTLTEPMTARLVAGLGLYTLISAAMQRTKQGKPKRIARVLIDEFQELAGRSFAALMAQSRKFGISLILANQSTSQLENRDLDLADIVFEGTPVKQYYTSAGCRDTEVLQSLSKDTTRAVVSESEKQMAMTTTIRHEVVPRLKRDTILDVSNCFGHSFVIINDGRGHRDPIRLKQTHDYPHMGHVSLPKRRPPGGNGKAGTRQPPLKPAERQRRDAALDGLLKRKQAALRWKEPA